MKQENLNWIAGFVAGIVIVMFSILLYSLLFVPNIETEQCDQVNAFTLESICTKNCNKYNSTSLLTWSYLDIHWHCSCENEGQAVTLW